MNIKTFTASIFTALVLASAADATASVVGNHDGQENLKEFRDAVRLYDKGMLNRSRTLFDGMSEVSGKADAEGYSVLCDVRMRVPGYEHRMKDFQKDHPYSIHHTQIRYNHALNLFDAQDYKGAAAEFALLKPKQLDKSQRTEFLFKRAYSDLENKEFEVALKRFHEVEQLPMSDYTAPSRYAIGYINYQMKDFREALAWFEQSAEDGRFESISKWYIMECRFMMHDYAYVVKYGPEMYETISADRRPHLARIISESYLVLGDADSARRYYAFSTDNDAPKSRADWFYSGSVLYAVEDYKGAIESFNKMGMRTDSIGQVANYHLAYSYIQTRNKVAAMEAFKDASLSKYDAEIAEDAYFNYAKLAFDLNNDATIFKNYLNTYSDVKKGDRIYSYIAVAALHGRDYAGAIDAYDKIDELDVNMRDNYMKANFLRASQLVRNGSYRKAIPCLKAAVYYSDKGSRFNQLSRYWLAESYYRNDDFQEARALFTELYNVSAMHGEPESRLIPYNIAYCFFKEHNYSAAAKWFSEYLDQPSVKYRKEALERKADCHFITKDYNAAADLYSVVMNDYFNANDIYPYYQAGLSYGLAKQPNKKIEVLTNVLEASPESKFYPEALFELGRSYTLNDEDENAFNCFRKLADSVKDSTFVAKAYVEMGSLARNQSQFNEALGYYKTVVEQMPLSGFADDALLAIESIYQTRNEPEEYLAYIETIGKGATKTADEKENMIFNSAEQIFLSENYQKALTSLQAYKEKYPNGMNVYKADFYIAESYKALGKKEQACDSYKDVISFGKGSFVEISMLNFSVLSYQLERWDDAYNGYQSLYAGAKLENNRFTAVTGMMRSAFKGHYWENALSSAETVLADARTDDSLKQEAEYVKAKSYLAVSRRDEAYVILRGLAADMASPYGAEAAYMLIQDSYDKGDFEDVETKVYAFSDSGSGQTYWLAKSFIVLGDSFAERGELSQAKATFESVRDGYTPSGADDDVQDNVRVRLAKLEEMIAEKNNQ